ncbi:MAG: TonB-dependent receptor [Kofleriaceae bacterium]
MRLRLACSFAVISLLLAWSGAAMAQATRTLTGVIITADGGGGVAGATIQIKDKTLTVTTGEDGTFTLAKVPAGEVVVQVSAEGYVSVEIPVKAGRGNTIFAATLSKQLPPPPPPTRAITVLVRDSASGLGLANATIRVQGTEIVAQTDPDGLFVLKDVGMEDLVLDIEAEGHNPSSVTVTSADGSAKVALTSSVAPAPVPETPAPAPAPQLTDEELAALAEAEAEASDEVIVVTGSAIERRELTTAAPVSVVDKADLEASGLSTVGDILQNLPAQSNGINAQANNGGDGSTRINLRGLGSARTLTLVNGRRVVPGGTGADSSVDINAIPLAVIERVEVLKDGASAIYGSDAIGGVVNIITRTDLNGSEATIYTGSTTRGDGFGYDLSLVSGTTSKKGNILFSAGYQSQEPVFAGDRSFSDHDKEFDYELKESSNSGSVSAPYGFIDAYRIDTDGDGMPEDDGVNLCGLEDDGTPIQYCRRGGPNEFIPFSFPDDFYNYQPENYLLTPSERYNVFSTGAYKLTNNVRAFFEGSYINRKSDQRLAPEPFSANRAPISAASVYNPTGYTLQGYNRRLIEFGPRRSLENVDTFRMVAGFDGSVPESIPGIADWKWELSYNFGRTQATTENRGNLINSRVANALGPSYFDANGVARCGTPEATIRGCVPLNLLAGADAKAVTQEMIDYTTYTGISSGYNRQQTVLASMHGRLAKTPWGGDIALAVGADYREEGGGFTPDPLTATGDTTGNASAPTDGSYSVKEGYAELSAVPVVGMGAVKWLEVNVAARAFDYDTFGSGATWKVGGLFRTVAGLGFRGTYSTAFRAPSVAALYGGLSDSFPGVKDPCDTTPPGRPAGSPPVVLDPIAARRCAEQGVPTNAAFRTSQQRAIVGGNPNLSEETANVLTAGVVFEPPMVKGLALTIDYFNVDIQKAIQALGAGVILSNCYSRDLDQFCDKIHRNAAQGYRIDFIDNAIDNVGGNATSGIDFSISYDHTYSFGRLRHSFEGTYLNSYDIDNTIQTFSAKGNYDFGVFPDLKTNFTTSWAKDGLSAGLNIRFISGYDECKDLDCNGLAEEDAATRAENTRKVPSNITTDIFAGYQIKSPAGVTSLSVGMNNVLDQDPPLIYDGFYADSDPDYDFLGRFVYARLSQQF